MSLEGVPREMNMVDEYDIKVHVCTGKGHGVGWVRGTYDLYWRLIA